MVNLLIYISGLTALSVVIIGYIFFTHLLLKYKDSKQNNILFIALLLFGMATGWLAASIEFIYYLTTGMHLHYTTMVFIYAWAPGLGLISWNYVFMDTLFPKYKVHMTVIYSILYAIILIGVYVFPEINTGGQMPIPVFEDFLTDSEYTGFSQIIGLVFIVTFIATGLTFVYYGFKAEEKELKVKESTVGFGIVLLATMAVMDGLILPTPIMLPIIRSLVILSFIMIWMGFIMPDFLKKRL